MNHRNGCPFLSGAFKNSLKRDVPYFKEGFLFCARMDKMKKPKILELRSGEDRRAEKDRRQFDNDFSKDERRGGEERRVAEDRRVYESIERLFILT